MAASSKSLFPVLFSILAELTQPVCLLISITTMPRPVGRRPCGSTGYRGRGAKIVNALVFSFPGVAADESVACAEARETAVTNAMMNSRGFIILNETQNQSPLAEGSGANIGNCFIK